MGDFSYYDRFFYESLGNIFKTARIRKHLSLRELSEKLQGARSKSTLKRYEDGETRLNEDDIALLCKALSLDKKLLLMMHQYKLYKCKLLKSSKKVMLSLNSRKLLQKLLLQVIPNNRGKYKNSLLMKCLMHSNV